MTPIYIAVNCAAVAVVFATVRPAMFDGYYAWLLKVEEKFPRLAMPLGACALCMAGQLSIWSSVFMDPTAIIIHIQAAAWGTLAAIPLNKLAQWNEQ